ncbi:MAG: hypothetical protein DMG96_08835 [Acidobacteria bacterium]|nr:MAG: hypothetical protein DMG96_08835 [Acidobacteriota bacterium]
MWTVFTSEMSASRSSSTNCISLFAGSILMGLWRQFASTDMNSARAMNAREHVSTEHAMHPILKKQT